VASLREQTYPNLEIICVDDGSTDRTFSIMRALERQGGIDRAVRCQRRGGKPSAANLAARLATGEILVNVDCDCTFDRHAIAEIVAPFAEPSVAAVSGNILIRNWRATVTTSLQAIEYLISISLGKTTSDAFNQVTCVSGAFGAFRRDIWNAIGGLDANSGEDFDVTMRLRARGKRIAFARKAICYTDVPETLASLARQRNRWERDAFWIRFRKFKQTLAPPSGRIPWQETIHQVDFLLFNVVCAAVFPIYLVALFLVYGSFAFYILLAAAFGLYLLDGLSFVLAVWFTGRPEYWRLAPFLVIFGPFQSYVMRFIRLGAYLDEWIFSKSRDDTYIPANVRAWSGWR
jgi:cellulose synthase/poly-beta-1,6-N-acetylglucosamine synthase-like glycosyltransferase